jgi:hypothetical protein
MPRFEHADRRTSCETRTLRWRKPDSNLYGAFSCQGICFWFLLVLCSERERAVLHPVAYDQVRGARGWGQGTETLAKLGGLPPSGACVSQRLDA